MASDMSARRLRIPLVLLPAIGGVAVAAIAVFFPEVLGVGYEATDKALRNEYALMFMLSLIVAKTVATAISLAARFGGGVFSPSLYLGAMTGGAFGLIAAAIFPNLASSEGLYALLGMGGVAAVVLGAPVSTTVMVFELTGGYALSIALLLTVSIAAGIANAFHGLSFFHWQLQRRGLFLSAGVHRNAVRSALVERNHDGARRFRPYRNPGGCARQPVADARRFTRIGVARVRCLRPRSPRRPRFRR